MEIAERLVARHAAWNGEHVSDRECLGLCDVAGEEQFANARDGCGSFGVVAIAVGLAVPDGFLVQLETVEPWHAEDHGAQPSIADRQRVGPLGCRLRKVQRVRAGWLIGLRLQCPQISNKTAFGDESRSGCGSGEKVASRDPGPSMFHRGLCPVDWGDDFVVRSNAIAVYGGAIAVRP